MSPKKIKDFSRPLSVFQVLFKANLIFKDFSRQSCIFKYFWSLCEPGPWLYFLKRKYSKTCLKGSLKRKSKIGFQDQLSLNAGQKYCRILPLAGKKYCRMLQSGAFCNTFDLHKAITGLWPLFCLFLSGCLRQVLLQFALSAVCDCGISWSYSLTIYCNRG